MNFKVFVTTGFKKHAKRIAKKHPSLKSDLAKLIGSLEKNPTQGDSLGKSCYKVRMAISSKARGKSGGSRVITCVKKIDAIVYLLAIYDKSEKESITDNQLDELLKLGGL